MSVIIGVVHIQSYKLHEGLECVVLSMVLCTKGPFRSFDKSRALSRLRAFFCRDIAMIVQKET